MADAGLSRSRYEHTTMKSSTPARAIIKGNVVRGNNWGKLPTKADIGIISAQNAQVRNNKVGASTAPPEEGQRNRLPKYRRSG